MIKKLAFSMISFSCILTACSPTPKKTVPIPTPAAESTPQYTPKTELEEKFMKFNCNFVAYIHHPKDKKANPLGLCFKTHTEVRGIYESSACVGVTIEPESEFESAFYGKKGHWGAEGKCSKRVLETLLAEKEKEKINSTVNPISSMQFKRHEGFKVDILRDDFGISTLVMARSNPAQNPRVMASH